VAPDFGVAFDLGEFTSSPRLRCAIATRGGEVLWANDSLGRAFGPSSTEVVGRPLVELFDARDRPVALRELDRLGEASGEGAFAARHAPVARGAVLTWMLRIGRDGLLYLMGTEVPSAGHDLGVGGRPAHQPDVDSLDHLTGTADRRSFEAALGDALGRCRADRIPLSLAIVDIDGLKLYNDTYGHLAGDECLVGVARVLLQRAARAGELVGRFGGDEFLVLWPGSDAATSARNADDIRAGIRALDVHRSDDLAPVAVSIGGVTVVPSAATTGPELVDAADRAMYESKRAGGDRTRWVTTTA